MPNKLQKSLKKRVPRKLKKKEHLRIWINGFNKYGKKFGYHIGNEALAFDDWIDYYEDGYTPSEAIREDMSYGF